MSVQQVLGEAMGLAPAKPFLKWAGGKTVLLPEILSRLPRKTGAYFEPFLGGGAVFFALAAKERFEKAHISDANVELITAYLNVADGPEDLIEQLQVHARRHCEVYYYAVRKLDPRKLDQAKRAARFIYLNRTCFNGLYRVNRSGQFNVPFGSYKRPLICDIENILAASNVIRKKGRPVNFSAADFEFTVKPAQRGDAVYFDPPYAPVSETANFTAYTSGGFGPKEHERLRNVAAALGKRGVHVLISNSDTPFIRDLYKNFQISEVRVPRRVNSKGSARGDVTELLISGRGT